MPTDLRTRLERSVGEVQPRPADTELLWQRGRRQRRVRQVTPVVTAVAVVALGIGAVVGLAGGAAEHQPLDGIEDGRNETTGWTEIPPGAAVVSDDLVEATPDDVEVVTPLLGHPGTPYAVDVRADGAVVTVFQHPDRGGVVVRHPQDAGWTRLGMPVPFLEDDAGYAVNTVQWGPDGRIYVTGMAPDAAARGMGLTQVVVLEEDGTVVGARENDDGQTHGFLFADGYAWQRQSSDPGRERWQPVAELGGKVLQMADQRAGDREDQVAPDGMALDYELVHEGPVFHARIGDDELSWQLIDDDGVGVGPHAPAGLRVAATATTRPMGGPLAWLSGGEEADGVAVHTVDREGRIRSVHLPHEVLPEPWGLVNAADATLGGDGHLYWVQHTPDGPVLMRYRHPLPS